jgi:hypothetical protein
MASSEDAAHEMKRIMEKLQLQAAERNENDRAIVLDIYTTEDQIKPEFAKKCQKWSDAAYAGDWNTIISVSQITSPRAQRLIHKMLRRSKR